MKTSDITRPHIESYNALFKNKIFKNVIKKVKPLVIDNFRLEISDYNIHQPYVSERNIISIDRRLLPRECRLANTTYKGQMFLKFNLYDNDKLVLSELRACGHFPVMVNSGFCHLPDSEDLSVIDEDENEIGGYFVINGIDKLVRFHIMQKRNYCFALVRPQKNKLYIDKYCYIRSVGDDELGQVNYIHYSVDDELFIRFFRLRSEFHIPAVVILKALVNTTDEELFKLLGEDSYMLVSLMKVRKLGVYSQNECIEFIGARFKTAINASSNKEACADILNNFVLPHLPNNKDKFQFIIESCKKLFHLVRDEIIPDDSDSPSSHEMLTETQLFANILRDRLEDLKRNFKALYNRSLQKQLKRKLDAQDDTCKSGLELFLHAYKYLDAGNVGKGFETFLSTGNLSLSNSSDILQTAGFCIIAERINFYRYISHFRSVNRGTFFQEVRTTGVRKLRSESWGFFCPVHTPDGVPCGLLTHMTCGATISNTISSFDTTVFYQYGVIPLYRSVSYGVPVFYNGQVVGYIKNAEQLVHSLRKYRRDNNLDIEIVHQHGLKLYECVQVYSTIARLSRPIKHSETGMTEQIGILEQVFLDIKIDDKYMNISYDKLNECDDKHNECVDERLSGDTGHERIGNILMSGSNKAVSTSNILMSGSNKSVSTSTSNNRSYTDSISTDNQSASNNIITNTSNNISTNTGNPLTNTSNNIPTNNKSPTSNTHFLYEEIDIQNILSIVASLTPFSEYNQSPRNMYQCQMAKQSMGIPAHNMKSRTDTKMYTLNYVQHPIVRNKNYHLVEDYPLGLNCIVAVLSYTAYDMEDAMVINKGSMERGLFSGYVYKVDKIELPKDCHFSYLPTVGHMVSNGDVLYKYMDLCCKETVVKCNSFDGYIIESIDIFQNITICANFKYRIMRNPNIGDKFCSRHGQKGVCSMHWPTADMPFTESGVVPDIIINPHAFPSRMTIGMLMESMAGKSGAFSGEVQDSTSFERNLEFDSKSAVHSTASIGDQLTKYGFNYYGNEPMYSGVTGNEFRTDIFIGVVYYQRLRHMVNDKFQVRTSGAVVATTRQPVGGRKKLGGVRFGEMERDAMIAHGTPYLLNDRLMKCSDSTVFTYCCKCKSVLFTSSNSCVCGGKTFNTLEMPYVFKYLCSELLAMNIRVLLDIKQP